MRTRPIMLLVFTVSILSYICVYFDILSRTIDRNEEGLECKYPKPVIKLENYVETKTVTITVADVLSEDGEPLTPASKKLKDQINLKEELSQKVKESNDLGKAWKDNKPSTDCSDVRFLSTQNQQQTSSFNRRVALASFPGSGNTWLRHLFHVTTGVWTGSVYFDKRLFNGGYPGEAMLCNDKSVFAIKAHTLSHARTANCKFDDVILILRNPYRAVLSEFNRRMGKSHTGVASKDAFYKPIWSKYAIGKGVTYVDILQDWLEFCNLGPKKLESTKRRCLIVNYDDMVKDTMGSMRKILTFLNLPLSRLKCLNSSNEEVVSGPFHRKHVNTEDQSQQSDDSDVNSKAPMCLLTKRGQRIFYNAIKQGSEIVSGLENGKSFSEALSRDTPKC